MDGKFHQGKRIFLFYGGFSGGKEVNPEAVHQHLHEVSTFQSYSFEPMPRLEKILKILGSEAYDIKEMGVLGIRILFSMI